MAHDTTLAGWQPASRIAANSRSNVKSLWVFALLWNVVSAPVLVYIPPELDRNPVAAIGFIFPVVGVGLLVWTGIATLRWRRFGEAFLDTGSAATTGTTWVATLRARLPEPGPDGYTVMLRLTCLLRRVNRRGDERTDNERIVWREESEVASSRIAFGAEGASIPVRFDIPADARATTAVGKGEGVLWVLTAEASLSGVNLKEDFDVPVRAGAITDQGAHSVPERSIVAPEELARTGVTVSPSADGMVFAFAPRRNVGFAFGFTVFTLVWTGALWLQWFLGFPWLFPILTGLFELLFLYIVINLWLGATAVTAGAGTLRVRHTVLGLGGTRTIAASDITGIELHIGMQTQGRHGTPYYDLRARLSNGRKVTLGGSVRNKRHAEWLADQIAGAIGVRASR